MQSTDQATAQRRRFSRIHFKATASLGCDGKRHPCALLDISLKGALLAPGDEGMPPRGSRCDLVLRLDDGTTEIRMVGHIAHIEHGRVGLGCEDIDLDSMTHLRRLVELNLGDETLLQRDLSALTAE